MCFTFEMDERLCLLVVLCVCVCVCVHVCVCVWGGVWLFTQVITVDPVDPVIEPPMAFPISHGGEGRAQCKETAYHTVVQMSPCSPSCYLQAALCECGKWWKGKEF